MRTILGLFTRPAESELESHAASDGHQALEVEEKQNDLTGQTVYSGTAAYEGSETVSAPAIREDGSIGEVSRTIDNPLLTEWFAVPDANPGFAAVDTGDGDFALRQIGSLTGGWCEEAVYDLHGFREHLEAQDATFWQILWSDSDEAGTWYPKNPRQDDHITERGLSSPRLVQLGFEYRYEGQPVRGTCAASGYLELYSPDWGPQAMAKYLQDEVLQFSGVPDVGSAEEIASGTADFSEAGPDPDDQSEDNRDASDDAQATLDDANSDDADESDIEQCEECGREPERDLHEGPNGRELCITCKDKAEEEVETRATRKLDDLQTVEMTDGGQTDE